MNWEWVTLLLGAMLLAEALVFVLALLRYRTEETRLMLHRLEQAPKRRAEETPAKREDTASTVVMPPKPAEQLTEEIRQAWNEA